MKNSNYESQKKYHREKMLQVKASFKSDFVTEFKQACDTLNISQADVIREAMNLTIKKAKKKQ